MGRAKFTTPLRTFTEVLLSHLLNEVTPSGSMLSAFPSRFPRLRTTRPQREGAVFRPPEREELIIFYRTSMNTQLSERLTISAALLPRGLPGFERTGRTTFNLTLSYEDRRRRQSEGIEKARTEGKYRGRQINRKLHRNIEALLRDRKSYSAIVDILGCSRSTIAAVKKQAVQEGQL